MWISLMEKLHLTALLYAPYPSFCLKGKTFVHLKPVLWLAS